MWVAGGGSLGLNTCSSEWQNKVCWFGLAAANRETCGISSATVGFAGETSSCKKFHSVLCLPSTPPSAVARFSADTFLPLGIHLRQFVFPLFTASAFLSLLICSLPFPLPLFFIPPPPAATVLQSVCASLRHVWGGAQWETEWHCRLPRLAITRLSFYLCIWGIGSLLPLGARGNNEVPTESHSSTAKQRVQKPSEDCGTRKTRPEKLVPLGARGSGGEITLDP